MGDRDIELSVALNSTDAISRSKDLQKEIQKIFEKTSGKQLDNTMRNTLNRMVSLSQQANRLRTKLEEIANTQIPTQAYKDVEEELKILYKESYKLQTQIEKMEEKRESGRRVNISDLERLQETLRQVRVEIERTQQEKNDLINSGQAFTQGTETDAYSRTESQLNAVNNSMATAIVRTEQLTRAEEESANQSSVGLEIRRRSIDFLRNSLKGLISMVAKTTVNAFKKLGNAIRTAMNKGSKSTDGMTKQVKTMIKAMIGIRSVYALWRKVSSAIKLGFSNLSQWNVKNNETAIAMNNLKNAITSFKNSLAAAFAPIFNLVAPALTRFINLCTDAANAVGRFFAALTGKKMAVQARKITKGISDGLEGTANNAKKANKELKKTLGFYDKLEVITPNDDNGNGSGSGGAGSLGDDIQNMFEYANVEGAMKDLVDKLKEAWKNADFTEFGVILGTKLRNALNSIPWTPIQLTAERIGKSLGTLLAGFISVTGLPQAIGRTIGQALNTVLLGLNSFLSNVPWKKFGEFLGTMFSSVLLARDVHKNTLITNIGKFLANAVNAGIGVLSGLVKTFRWNAVGTNIGKALSNTILSIKWNQFGRAIGDGINGIFTLINSIVTNFDFAETANKIASGINEAIRTIDWSRNGQTLGRFVSGIFTSLNSFIQTTDWESLGKGIVQFIVGFFQSFDWGQFTGTLTSFVAGLFNFIAGAIKGINWRSVPRYVATSIVRAFKGMNWKSIFQGIGNLAGTLVSAIFDFEVGLSEVIGDVGNKIVAYFNEELRKAGFDRNEGFISAGRSIIVAFYSGIKNALIGLTSWISENIVMPFVNGFNTGFTASMNEYNSIGQTIIHLITSGFQGGLADLVNATTNLSVTVANAFDANKITTFFENAFKSAFNKAKNVFENAPSFFNGIWNKIKQAFSNTGTWFQSTFSTAWSKLKSAFNQSTIKSYFNSVWSGIKSAFSNVSNWFKNTFTSAWNAVKRVFSSGGAAFSGIREGIVNSLKVVINGLIDGINASLSTPFQKLNESLTTIKNTSIPVAGKVFSGIPTITVPRIPRLAQGAVIPPNKEFLAVLGDQKNGTNIETPLATMKQAFVEALASTNVNTNNQPIVLNLDGKTVAEVVWDETEKRYKQVRSGTINPFYI